MIRKFARPMLASVFIADGVDTLRNQQDHEEGARDFIARVRSVTPNQYNAYIPRDEKTVVRAVAGTKIAAGSLYALGKTPRLAATALVAAQIPTMLARHAFWETQDEKEKAARRTGFLTDLGLLGGLFLATADTAGKPGVAWRAEKAGKDLNKKVQAALPTKSETEKRTEELNETLTSAGDTVREKAGLLRERAGEAAGGARESLEGARDYVDENKDSWREQVTEAFDTAKSYVEDNKDDWFAKATEFAEDAREYAEDLTKDFAKDFKASTKDLRAGTKKQRKALSKRAAKATKEAKKAAKQASKDAKKALN